jgi:anhydro-N-acetylmuramic acid kinase
MSGTSLDGIDAGLVDFSDGKIRLVAFHYTPFPPELRQRIHELSQPEQAILLKDYGQLDSQLGQMFAEAAMKLLELADIPPAMIKAIGSHGQTIYHEPVQPYGFSLQIGDPNRIAQHTGITTIADFRRRDIAVGGQGAPLVPAFHQAAFADETTPTSVLNIGGIANVTILDGEHVAGFDTGPGNTLMDYWCQQHCQKNYDAQGDWAASGQVNSELLMLLQDDDYFQLAPPKSTGKEYFSPAWLHRKLHDCVDLPPQDVQATLCQLTANSITDAVTRYAGNSMQILACGGGTHNRQLLKALSTNLKIPVLSTAERGISPDHVEAIAFAWLARQTLNGLPGNLCKVTGASQPVILGGIYPGQQNLC